MKRRAALTLIWLVRLAGNLVLYTELCVLVLLRVFCNLIFIPLGALVYLPYTMTRRVLSHLLGDGSYKSWGERIYERRQQEQVNRLYPKES